MGEVYLRAEVLELRECLELCPVVNGNRLEHLAETCLSIFRFQMGDGFFDTGTRAPRNADCDVVLCHLFHSGKYGRAASFPRPDNGVGFPVSDFRALVHNGRTILYAAPFQALVLAPERLRDIEQRQRNPVRPQHIVKRLGAWDAFLVEPFVRPGIPDAHIDRPLVLAYFFGHPTQEWSTDLAVNLVWSFGVLSMREVSLLPSFCRILRRPPASRSAFRRPTCNLIVDRCMRASNPCGYGAKRESLTVKCLYLPSFIKGKVLSRFTNGLRCGRMGVIHSDCSFADVL